MLPRYVQTSPPEKRLDACRGMLNARDILDPPIEELIYFMKILLKRTIFPLTVCIICGNVEKQRGHKWSHCSLTP